MRALVKHELQEPTKLSVLLLFSVLISAAYKAFLIGYRSSFSSTYPHFHLHRVFVEMGHSNMTFYLFATLMASFIVGISTRTERDTGVALSIYALPYSRKAILMAKFFSNFLLIFVYSLALHIIVFVLHFSGTVEGVLKALSEGIPFVIIFYIIVTFYVVSLSSFVAISSPNTYVAIMVSFLALYFPVLANIKWLMPALTEWWEAGLSTYATSFKTLIFLSVVLFIGYVIIGERRDVR